MDLLNMLAELRAERKEIDEAIRVTERLAAGTRGKRRGRPPNWLAALQTKGQGIAPTKKPVRSAATPKRMAEAQNKRSAAKKAREDS
jgi:hypothetical protein